LPTFDIDKDVSMTRHFIEARFSRAPSLNSLQLRQITAVE